jgi:flagellar basal-body rod modification protein FlgD
MNPVSAITTASDIQMDYMKLLITQLQNQNPLEPLDNNEMASQLAQFSQLQQLESMNASFADILVTSERTYASSLIGREVSFLVETEAGGFGEMRGTVNEVFNDPQDGIILMVNTGDGSDYTLNLNGVISVKN